MAPIKCSNISLIAGAIIFCQGQLSYSFGADIKKPNIVYILCDDLGYGDVKAFNPEGKIATPHMDRLAREGMVFTDAHSGSAVCSPTRYGIMTGRYAWRSPLKAGVLGGLSPRLIEPGRLTVAQFLKDHGYHTAAIGKWHLGMDWQLLPGKEVNLLSIESRDQVFNVQYDKPITNGPRSVGFDYFFGISASLDMVPYTFIENEGVTKQPTVDRDFPLMQDREMGPRCRKGPAAADFEVEHVLPTLTQKAVQYIRDQAKRGKPFFLYLPYASPHTPIAPTKEYRDKSGLNRYGDFVMETDASIGEVLTALDEAGVAENTLVIVTSDNGCSPQAKFEELLPKGHNPNYVFRGHKADIYEGGHRVPFIVRWPAVVKAGTTTDQVTSLTDFFATCVDIVGGRLPANAAEDSFSLLPVLRGVAKEPVRPNIVHHSANGSFAIREGKWKLCVCPGSGGWSKPRPKVDDTSKLPQTQLFDLSTDISETTNLVDQHPEIARHLMKILEDIVSNGRSTPGEKVSNTTPVDIQRGIREAQMPRVKKKAN